MKNRIKQIIHRKILAVPIVDGIKWDTLEHEGYNGDTKAVGIFEWVLLLILTNLILNQFSKLKNLKPKPKGFLYKEMRISDSDFAKKSKATEPNPYLYFLV